MKTKKQAIGVTTALMLSISSVFHPIVKLNTKHKEKVTNMAKRQMKALDDNVKKKQLEKQQEDERIRQYSLAQARAREEQSKQEEERLKLEKAEQERQARLAMYNHSVDIHTNINAQLTDPNKIDNQLFKSVAQNYPQIDIGFAYSVWRLETSNGTSSVWLTKNNPGGIGGQNNYHSYSSQEDGFHGLFKLLIKYVDKYGLNTPYTIGCRWDNSDWGRKVVEVWSEYID